MLIFGTRNKTTWTSDAAASVPCDACNQKSLRPFVVQRYFHVFWIPVIPIGKNVLFECGHCQRTLEPKDGPRELDTQAQRAKASARTPLYMFVGLALLAVLLSVGAVQASANAKNAKAWIAAPRAGDLYVLKAEVFPELKGEGASYVVARVDGVTADGVNVEVGSYGYSVASGAKKAIRKGDVGKDGYFEGESVPLAREQLEAWLKDERLTDVVRD
jgi:hypothetical protein